MIARHPQGRGRPALVRRHRHLCARLDRDRCRGRRQGQRRDPHHRQGHPRQGRRRRRQPRRDAARPHRIRAEAAAASTPTPSTIRPASTPPTSRSTSRSRSAALMRTGQARPSRSRNEFLAAMTDEVAALCLRNNYLQTLALSLAEQRGLADFPDHRRADRGAGAARPAEPRRRVPARRRGARRARRARPRADPAGARGAARLCQERALRRPARRARCPTTPISATSSTAISRERLVETFPDAVTGHRLRREVIATVLANAMINRGGPAFVNEMMAATSADAGQVAAAYAAARDAYGLAATQCRRSTRSTASAGRDAARRSMPRSRRC